MKLVVATHKICWADPTSPSGYSTKGGFPLQMQAIADLFSETTIVQLHRLTPPPADIAPITGKNLSVHPMVEPKVRGLVRKLAIWRVLPILWREVRQADAVHAPIPGHVGTIGILVALMQRKPLFVRDCGTWGTYSTLPQRFLVWLLPRVAGGQRVVMATGGGDTPPAPENPDVTWIFSTSLTEAEWQSIEPATAWQPGQPPRLISVGRLSAHKNMQAIIRALPLIQQHHPEVTLDILGDGDYRHSLEQLISQLNLEDSVKLHGNVSHSRVLQLLAQSHIFVFPTQTREGFPKAVLEALACGLPVVAAPVSVIPYLLSQGSGVVLDGTDHEAVSESVLTLLSEPHQLAEMSQIARIMSKEYTLEKWGEQIGARLTESWQRVLSQ